MSKYEVRFVPIDALLPNPLRPRFHHDHQKLLTLADSLRQYGMFHPILVGNTSAGLQIISGDRRWRAARLAGLKEVPVVAVKVSTKELLLLFLEENAHREELNILEHAHAIKKLLEISDVTIELLEERLRMDAQLINQLLLIYKLPEHVKEKFLEGVLTEEELLHRAQI